LILKRFLVLPLLHLEYGFGVIENAFFFSDVVKIVRKFSSDMTLEFNPLTSILSIFGALGVAGLIGWIKKARLVALVPKTFSYSELTESGHGQLVEIAVFNRGWKTEDTIDVTMNPTLSYQMLGANSQDVKVEKNRLKISRVGPADEITTLLIVEKGTFQLGDILQIVSKESKGIIVSKAEEIGLTGPQRIQAVVYLVIMLLTIGAIVYFFSQITGYSSASQNEPPPAITKKDDLPVKVGDWNIEEHYRSKDNSLYQGLLKNEIKFTVGTAHSKGDSTLVPVRMTNTGASPLLVTLSMNSNASAGRIPSYELRSSEITLAANQTIERSIRVIIPIRSSEVDRSVYMEVFIRSIDGETLQMKQIYTVK
jgi:hypothetical protein